MGRFLVFMLGLAVIAGVAWSMIGGVQPAPDPEVPTRELQQARDAAKRIETDWQQRADDSLGRSAP